MKFVNWFLVVASKPALKGGKKRGGRQLVGKVIYRSLLHMSHRVALGVNFLSEGGGDAASALGNKTRNRKKPECGTRRGKTCKCSLGFVEK